MAVSSGQGLVGLDVVMSARTRFLFGKVTVCNGEYAEWINKLL
jgi:hypothetical protein